MRSPNLATMTRAITAGAKRGLGFDIPLDPRQVFRETTAVGDWPCRPCQFPFLKRVTSHRHATSVTRTPDTKLSATVRARSPSLQSRRPERSLRVSILPVKLSVEPSNPVSLQKDVSHSPRQVKRLRTKDMAHHSAFSPAPAFGTVRLGPCAPEGPGLGLRTASGWIPRVAWTSIHNGKERLRVCCLLRQHRRCPGSVGSHRRNNLFCCITYPSFSSR